MALHRAAGPVAPAARPAARSSAGPPRFGRPTKETVKPAQVPSRQLDVLTGDGLVLVEPALAGGVDDEEAALEWRLGVDGFGAG
jgi:hypothetical protein